MTTLNRSAFTSTTQVLVNSATTATTAEDIVLLSKAVNNESNDQILYVSSGSSLPDLSTTPISTGTMIYVLDIDVFVIANPPSWYSADGRLFRTDTLPPPPNSLWSWGTNVFGQLGDNTNVTKVSPVSVVGGFTNWIQMSSSGCHAAAIRHNGTMWTWGLNACGQLGTNSLVSRSSPGSIVGTISNWCQVSAGFYHTSAVRTTGALWTWGRNDVGQLGDNTTTIRLSPVSIVGGFTDWCQVASGGFHTIAVRTNGTLWAWGNNYRGQLGVDDITNRSSPVSVIGGFTDWCQVSASLQHTAAIRTNGTLWTWGRNNYGQLGVNDSADRSSPVSVVGGFTNWCQVSVGSGHTAAVRTNGTLWTWGAGATGQLGTGNTASRSSPGSIIGGFTDWCQVGAGPQHTAAVRTNGTVWTWGSNAGRQLGDNTIVNKSSPVSVVGGFTDWYQVSAGIGHTTALRSG